jgi:hypothetical protein
MGAYGILHNILDTYFAIEILEDECIIEEYNEKDVILHSSYYPM